MKKVLVKLGRQIEKVHGSSLPSWLQNHRRTYDFMCCAFESIHPSPVVDGYRNKCEFTVGWDPTGQQKMVGFRLAKYSAGSVSVANADECTIVSKKILAVVNVSKCKIMPMAKNSHNNVGCCLKAFQEYVRKSDKNPYNPEDHSGYWRQLTVRNTTKDDIMAVVVMHPQVLSKVRPSFHCLLN